MQDRWRREDSAAAVIARAMRSARLAEGLDRLHADGLALTPGVVCLVQRYADGALRLRELVYLAHARAAGDASSRR